QSGFSQNNIESSAFTLTGGEINRGMRYFWRVKAYDPQDSSRFSSNILYFDFYQLGDANADFNLSPADIVTLLNYLFLGITPPSPFGAVDMNCDGVVSSADLVLALNTIFLAEPPPCDP
ncbi:MAG TPA: dockerin type I domain-containing protein, partial [candidate division Zixibacteria bacterium]|nr:dockerin type I domain-containing protein [candidate division Zixibacteria bacterium]